MRHKVSLSNNGRNKRICQIYGSLISVSLTILFVASPEYEYRAMHRDANYGGYILEGNIDRSRPRTRKSRTINPRAGSRRKICVTLRNNENIYTFNNICTFEQCNMYGTFLRYREWKRTEL